MDGEEPTQATQDVLDPRRVGKQNTGFSDEDISDIICVLYPHTESARVEVRRLALEDSPHIIGKSEADEVQPDYELEDDASRFEAHPPRHHGNHAIILKLSSLIKHPSAGFAFGRNRTRCDVVFVNDPLRRVSNIHFRIYVNEYGNVMIEDQSTNGTLVDRQLLSCRARPENPQIVNKWVLSSGNLVKIPLHTETQDLVFLVRIPRRDDHHDRAYIAKVDQYFAHHGCAPGNAESRRDANPGTVDIFKVPGGPLTARHGTTASPSSQRPKDSSRAAGGQTEWKGSGMYNRTGIIGQGAFAVVHKVTAKYDGRPYAAKEIEKRRFIKNGILDQKVENEMKIMQRVQHPNIVRFIEHLDWEERLLIIIMEYVPHGDLSKTVSAPGSGPLTTKMTQTVATQLLSALGYLHANNITHRDVKPDNILIHSFDPLVVKLTDFGLSKMVENTDTFLQTFCGTLLYCAPEVYTEYTEYDDNGLRVRGQKRRRIPGQRYNHAVDIWSLGGVLFYCLTAAPPYPVKSGISYSELLHMIMTTDLNVAPLLDKGVTDAGIDFIQRMLQRRPEHRATIPELQTHAWLAGSGSVVQASQSYDEITDDEEYPSQLQLPTNVMDDRISDSMSDLSNEEMNLSASEAQQQSRLFGEVGASALASSGVMPADFLSLRSGGSSDAMDMLQSQIDEAYDSADSHSVRGKNQQAYHHNTTCLFPNQSADQLQSLVADVASQSLGDHDSYRAGPTTLPHLSLSMDPSTSKRKPPSSNEASGDYDDENTPPVKPIIKRLKSESSISEDTPEEALAEYRLLARMPQVMRLDSGRQIDLPVSKIEFWEQDRATWHLDYPEMTQLQHDAFKKAAHDGGEEFGPGKTALWNLAMKHFPPTARKPGLELEGRELEGRDWSRATDASDEFPATAAPESSSQLPDTCPPDAKIVVPIQGETVTTNRLLAWAETDASSCVQGVNLPMTDTLLSFGRGLDNTNVFPDGQELRVPKYAFKLMLWKEGFDPSRPPSSSKGSEGQPPWTGRDDASASSYHIWLSTKATLGIKINHHTLASSKPKNPGGPSLHWAKLHDGDSLVIWGSSDSAARTRLTFRCIWGGSATRRPAHDPRLEFASASTAAKLDLACQRTERRIKEAMERNMRVREAKAQWAERKYLSVESERERSRLFEAKRQEAVAFLKAREALAARPRRTSPASAPATSHSLHPGGHLRLGPVTR